MALSEIEKLERRYAENPQGLTFAPLAEVHRKNGEVRRALDLLGPGLAIHPDYIPASIVLGRCYLDLGDMHAAETAFLHVLSLDGENVIALKALADISERLRKFDDTERWLRTLLSVDRSNDEAREQLQRVEISRRQAETASAAAPESAVGSAEPLPTDGATAFAEPPLDAPDAAPSPAYEPPVAEPAMGWVSQSSQASELVAPPVEAPPLEELEPSTYREPDEHAAGVRLQEPLGYEAEVEPITGLVGREVDVPDEAADEFAVETSEDIVLRSSGGSEFQMPDASQELFASGVGGQRGPFEKDAQVSPPVPTEPEPEPPRVISDQRAPVTFEAEPPTIAPPVSPTPRRAYAAGETGGRPVARLLKDILAARPPAQAAAPAVRQPDAGEGAPTRPAADALSLSSVFGEETPGTPPAVPAAGTGQGVSFDDFFGAPGAAPTQRTTRAPDPKNDDLDQFHAWLQNLKR